ncbi:hypothetical protein TNCV_1670051 [Trichonephila clavipes]|nr:hypothetical protein TNCV_1670051 [Trichonephila clavipes]
MHLICSLPLSKPAQDINSINLTLRSIRESNPVEAWDLSAMGPNAMFMDENGRVHTTRVVNQYIGHGTLLR